MTKLRFEEVEYALDEGETVLECLERHRIDVPSLCRSGACQSCLLRATAGTPPAVAQQGLKLGWKSRGLFLACVCKPREELQVERADAAATFETRILEARQLSPAVVRVLLEKPAGFDYAAGQFARLTRKRDGISRAYSLASLPSEPALELHVAVYPNGALSPWLAQGPTEPLDLSGPFGDCCYLEQERERSLLLAGTGTGLAPLLGIVRDACAKGHRGPIRLFWGARNFEDLYFWPQLSELAIRNPQLQVFGSVLQGDSKPSSNPRTTCTRGDLQELVLTECTEPAAVTAYLCGNPDLVHQLKKKLFLAGCALANIYSDPFVPPAS